jgi:hypothetical protein
MAWNPGPFPRVMHAYGMPTGREIWYVVREPEGEPVEYPDKQSAEAAAGCVYIPMEWNSETEDWEYPKWTYIRH